MLVLAVLGNNPERRAVKGAGSHVTDTGAKESFSKFVTGFAREGHGQYLVGADLLVRDAALNAQGQDVSLTGTGRGANEQTPTRRHHGFALLRRESDEQVVGKRRFFHSHPDATGR